MKKPTKATRAPLVKRSAQQIWLAGLGAFAMAEEEGGKLFGQLVKRGATLEKMNRSRVEKVLARIGRMRSTARETLGETVEKLTTPIDSGVAAALHQFGVPTRKEIVTLTRRVEELTRAVEKKAPKAKKPHEAEELVTTEA